MNKQQKIEKIREIVIMKNNPECKSYEEALENEQKNNYCLIKFNNGFITDCVNRSKNIKLSQHTILGLPLTLERLLICLGNGFECIVLKSSEPDNNEIYFGVCNDKHRFFWQPNKLLEEQSEETIEKIYNILF